MGTMLLKTLQKHVFLSLLIKLNEVNAYGNTPLHLACYNGQDVVVSELIEAGANVNQVCIPLGKMASFC